VKRLTPRKPTRKSVRIFIRALLGVTLFTLLFSVVYFRTGPTSLNLYEGDISLNDIYAPYDFTYTGDIDEAKMDASRKIVLADLKPVYIVNLQMNDRISQVLAELFVLVRQTRAHEGMDDAEKVKMLVGSSNIPLTNETYVSMVAAKDISLLVVGLNKILDAYLASGILSATDKEALESGGASEIVILDIVNGTERIERVADIPTLEDFEAIVQKESGVQDRGLSAASKEIVKTLISSNLESSVENTQKREEDLLSTLPNVYKKATVKKNEILIGKGEKVAKRHLKMLSQLGNMGRWRGKAFYMIGMALLLAIFLVISTFHLKFYESKIFKNNKDLVLISISAIFVVLLSEVVISSPFSSYLIPLASASMLIAILLDAHSAFIFTVVMSIFIGVVAGNNFGLAIVMMVGGSVGIYSVRKVRRRSKLLLAGLLIGVANLLTITALNFINNIDLRLFLAEGGMGLMNGLLSYLLVFGFLPMLEYLFKIPTDISLLELSDLNHPLLKEMATKAPGTYHHSLIVGNLAETACDAIGANTLLARVGAYYHDIGKIEKAEYFSENESEPKNSRHDALAPSMSALVIINHVKDGVALALKHKLNQALIDFIAQHHGNGLIYFFYQRALEKAQDEHAVDEDAFRYPGPKPQSKETAIVLLADSVEASSRTLANPTPSRVQGLVQRIINNKFIDGQLDECNLTLKDLHRISEAFMRILNAMFHTRVEYPDDDEQFKSARGRNNGKKPDQKPNIKGPLNNGNGKKDT